MPSLPLHPAIVHLPLGLAFLMPALALGFGWALWTGRIRARAWIAIVALQAVLLGGGLAAMNTGEREEDRVETLVPRAAIHAHEDFAEQFVWGTAATLGLTALVLVVPHRTARRALTAASVIGTVVVMALAIRVGHAGGELVYVHNAGAAYTPARTASADAVEAGAAHKNTATVQRTTATPRGDGEDDAAHERRE